MYTVLIVFMFEHSLGESTALQALVSKLNLHGTSV